MRVVVASFGYMTCIRFRCSHFLNLQNIYPNSTVISVEMQYPTTLVSVIEALALWQYNRLYLVHVVTLLI
jgi:hypothetical protein